MLGYLNAVIYTDELVIPTLLTSSVVEADSPTALHGLNSTGGNEPYWGMVSYVCIYVLLC